jgi:hypothetical protein
VRLTQEEFKQALKNRDMETGLSIIGLTDKGYSDIMDYIVEEDFGVMFFNCKEMSGSVQWEKFEIEKHTSTINEFWYSFNFNNGKTKFFVDKIKSIQIFDGYVNIQTENSRLTFE